MQTRIQQIILAKRPEGPGFQVGQRSDGGAGKDEVPARMIHLSLDPDAAPGREAASGAIMSMLKGGNFGKRLVKISEPGR